MPFKSYSVDEKNIYNTYVSPYLHNIIYNFLPHAQGENIFYFKFQAKLST